MKQENRMLKETGSISKKEANEMRNAEKALHIEIAKLTEEKKVLNLVIQKKDLEVANVNKKIIDVTEDLKKSRFY